MTGFGEIAATATGFPLIGLAAEARARVGSYRTRTGTQLFAGGTPAIENPVADQAGNLTAAFTVRGNLEGRAPVLIVVEGRLVPLAANADALLKMSVDGGTTKIELGRYLANSINARGIGGCRILDLPAGAYTLSLYVAATGGANVNGDSFTWGADEFWSITVLEG